MSSFAGVHFSICAPSAKSRYIIPYSNKVICLACHRGRLPFAASELHASCRKTSPCRCRSRGPSHAGLGARMRLWISSDSHPARAPLLPSQRPQTRPAFPSPSFRPQGEGKEGLGAWTLRSPSVQVDEWVEEVQRPMSTQILANLVGQLHHVMVPCRSDVACGGQVLCVQPGHTL